MVTTVAPKIASVREIQRNYRRLFNDVTRTKQPLVLTTNAKPEVVVLALDTYEAMNQNASQNSILKARREFTRFAAKLGQMGRRVNLAEFVVSDRRRRLR